MKKLAKTDRFIELLQESLFVILYFPDPPETLECWLNIKEQLFQRLTRSYYVLRYQLGGGFFQINIHPDNNNKTEDILDRLVKKYHNDELYPEIIKEILQNEKITYKDVINEFWELCPDMNHIEEILNVSRVKFKETLSQFPDPLENSTEKLFQNNSNYFNSNVSELERRGFISEEEGKYILFKIDEIIETANRIIDLLAMEFNKIKEMSNGKSTQPSSTNKNLAPTRIAAFCLCLHHLQGRFSPSSKDSIKLYVEENITDPKSGERIASGQTVSKLLCGYSRKPDQNNEQELCLFDYNSKSKSWIFKKENYETMIKAFPDEYNKAREIYNNSK